jgi:hypothetical protein
LQNQPGFATGSRREKFQEDFLSFPWFCGDSLAPRKEKIFFVIFFLSCFLWEIFPV